MNKDNAPFRRAQYSVFSEIRSIELFGWQHTGGAVFDNISVMK